jgi:hypothetical protein
LVVTPSTSPVAARSRISLRSAVSMKNFIILMVRCSHAAACGALRVTHSPSRG